MKVLFSKEKGIKYALILPRVLLTTVFIAILVRYPQESSQGVRQGLRICSESVIPSLFPLSVLCTFLTASGLCSAFGKVISPLMKKLFRLPGCAAGAVIMGMLAGYPVGVRMTEELLRGKCISQNDANRMCLFCLGAGPAFMIGTVGTSILNNPSAGKLLFLSSCLSSLTVGVLLRFTATNSKYDHTSEPAKSIVNSLCEAVSSAGSAMLSVSTWIIFFTCICMTLKELPDPMRVPLCALLEVTNGTKEAAKAGVPLPVISAILGWAGLSVHCQVWKYIEKCEVKPSHFVVSRIVGGALSALYCKWLMRFFPMAQSVVLTGSGLDADAFSVSAPVSAAMLLTAGIFIIKTCGMTDDIYKKFTKKNP